MKVLLVEDDPSAQEIVRDILKDIVIDIEICGRGDEAEALIRNVEWDLVMLDIMLPGKDGFQLLKVAKEVHKFTPVVMFTAIKDRENRIKAYEMGVDDFVTKPFDRWEFLARVRSLLNLRGSYQRLEETRNVVITLAHAVEAKDPYTRGHSDRVGEYSRKISLALGFSQEKAEDLYWAGLLHDIGKIAVPLDILTKPDCLTYDEYEKVKIHPEYSYKICQDLRTLQKVLPAIKYHHERWDGKGYPEGLKGKDIPAEARIMSVADAYDAMTSDRAYRKAMSKEKAVLILKEGKDKQWQASIVDTFIDILETEDEEEKN
ncbi:MAG: HD domain-containing protein [Elusimicrobia bacterium]|nr:HD domain-containing protein [Elusimicrobiota bacterium]